MKAFSYILVAVLSFALAVGVVSVGGLGADEYDLSNNGNNLPSFDDQQESTTYSTYYEQLNDYQKAIYSILKKTVENAEAEVVFSNVNVEDFQRNIGDVCIALQYDYPEYFWFTGGRSYSRPTFTDVGDITFSPIYYNYVSGVFDHESKLKELENAVTNLANLAQKHSSDDYERIVFVHDYLIKNAIYDHDALNEYYKTSRSPSCEYIFSAYGCLVNGKTVCSGYAKAFQLVMRELGYDCTYVTGLAGERHGWNCVYLNGEGYFVDITWDDGDFKKEVPLYNYAFITSNTLSKTHSIDMPFDVPVCTATEYNYFIRRGYYLEKYDFDAVAEIMKKQKNNDAIYIQFGSRSALGEAIAELMYGGKIHRIDGINVATYTHNENHHTLTIFTSK